MTALSAFQYLVGHWGEKTFGEAPSVEGLIRHLEEEAAELKAAADAEQSEEAADCLILLLRIAHEQEFDLLEAAREKLTVLRKRQWHPPDGDGICRHVKSGEEAEFTVADMLHRSVEDHREIGFSMGETVGDMIAGQLDDDPEYDGLCNEEGCGCGIEDIGACIGCASDSLPLDCVAAHWAIDGFVPGPRRKGDDDDTADE